MAISADGFLHASGFSITKPLGLLSIGFRTLYHPNISSGHRQWVLPFVPPIVCGCSHLARVYAHDLVL